MNIKWQRFDKNYYFQCDLTVNLWNYALLKFGTARNIGYLVKFSLTSQLNTFNKLSLDYRQARIIDHLMRLKLITQKYSFT